MTAVEIDRTYCRCCGPRSSRWACGWSRPTPSRSTGRRCSGRAVIAVDPGGQSALQRGRAPGHPGAGGGPPGGLAAGHGPAGGGGAAGRRGRGRGLRGGVGEGGLLGHGRGGGRVPASVFIPRPRVESVLVRLDRRPGARRADGDGGGPGRPATSDSSPWSGPGSPTAARCCAARSSGWFDPRRSPPPASGPRPGPRSWRLGRVGAVGLVAARSGRTGLRCPALTREAAGDRAARRRPAGGRAVGAGQADPEPAVTGVRADGYHLLESEMVTLDLADTLRHRDGRPA